MDRVLLGLGLLSFVAAGLFAWYFPAMPAWVFLAVIGAGIVMVAGGG